MRRHWTYNAIGTKRQKKVTQSTTITTTEYVDGFQFVNNTLEFFPHAEGYVKAIPSGSGYSFNYVFTYTDHYLPPTREARPRGRHNIRLKYAQDPNDDNEVKILEEDHYYPGACPERSRRGLKHTGYNSKHLVFGTTQGGAIALSEETPALRDSYRYKFGGMEYQDEFDINSYDFGARKL